MRQSLVPQHGVAYGSIHVKCANSDVVILIEYSCTTDKYPTRGHAKSVNLECLRDAGKM